MIGRSGLALEDCLVHSSRGEFVADCEAERFTKQILH